MTTRPRPCSVFLVDSSSVGLGERTDPTLSLGPGARDSEASGNYSTYALNLVGRTFDGRYEVLRMIGAGGMGLVFEARHRFTGRLVALKLLNPRFGRTTCLREAFYREVRLLGRLDHPNVCAVYDLGHTDEGYPFAVLPLLRGRHLADWLDEPADRFPWARIADVFTQILHGVVAMHDAAVVHRDLKPTNLWLGRLPNGLDQVTIIDFGIAATQGEDLRSGDEDGRAQWMFAGTPRYMAPELVRGETRLDRRLDVYSLGVVLLDLLTGDTTGDLGWRRTKRGMRTMAPRWARLAGVTDAPAQLGSVLDRALAVDPADRHISTRSFRTAFFQVAHRADPLEIAPTGAAVDSEQRLVG